VRTFGTTHLYTLATSWASGWPAAVTAALDGLVSQGCAELSVELTGPGLKAPLRCQGGAVGAVGLLGGFGPVALLATIDSFQDLLLVCRMPPFVSTNQRPTHHDLNRQGA
jgi:hypothetical protein